MRMSTKNGFTLAEVVVVVGIIAVMTAIVLPNFNEFRAKGRDVQRLSDLETLNLAIRMYAEQNGQYPDAGCSGTGFTGPGPASFGTDDCDVYIAGLTPTYISRLPLDPREEMVSDRGFMYQSDGTNYKLMVYGSVEHDTVGQGEKYARCPASCTESYCSDTTHYAVYSAGAACW